MVQSLTFSGVMFLRATFEVQSLSSLSHASNSTTDARYSTADCPASPAACSPQQGKAGMTWLRPPAIADVYTNNFTQRVGTAVISTHLGRLNCNRYILLISRNTWKVEKCSLFNKERYPPQRLTLRLPSNKFQTRLMPQTHRSSSTTSQRTHGARQRRRAVPVGARARDTSRSGTPSMNV